ncbi:unnamed protein product, partial [Sphacelaria rigidula]
TKWNEQCLFQVFDLGDIIFYVKRCSAPGVFFSSFSRVIFSNFPFRSPGRVLSLEGLTHPSPGTVVLYMPNLCTRRTDHDPSGTTPSKKTRIPWFIIIAISRTRGN